MTEILDRKIIDELLALEADGAPGFFTSLLDVFDQQCDESLLEMREHLATRRFDSLSRSAHKLKGSARTIGAASVGELCEQLELLARDAEDGKTTEIPPDLVTAIETAIRDARRALRSL